MTRIFLWGFMASGKTKLGKRLAKKLQYQFIDLDEFIEVTHQKTVTDLFALHGEEGFRLIEREALHKLFSKERVVISCGGGSPCFFDNAEQMNTYGITVFLKVSLNVLIQRLWKNKQKRPIVAAIETQKKLTFNVFFLLSKRMKWYRKANYVYDNSYPKSDLNDLLSMISKE